MKQSVEIIRSSRRTLAIEIRPSGELVVRAPFRTKETEIRRFLQDKSQWILHAQEHVRQQADKALSAGAYMKRELGEIEERAREIIPSRVAFYAEKLDVHPVKIGFRFQKTKWGSCTSQNHLSFNCLLAEAPPYVLDYVVVHELCHIHHMNHSKAFYAEIATILPNYKEAEAWLHTEGRVLMMRKENAK